MHVKARLIRRYSVDRLYRGLGGGCIILLFILGTTATASARDTTPPEAPTGLKVSLEPGLESDAWTCSRAYYGTGDGCDCSCGAPDPDCNARGCIGPDCEDSACDAYHATCPAGQQCFLVTDAYGGDDGGHVITLWGYSVAKDNPNVMTGVFLTDSDDDKRSTNPPDRLFYREAYWDGIWHILEADGSPYKYIKYVYGLRQK